ncbi:DUF4258 domain-containing protein [Chloroflexi bacterium CFX6]|nr:DUF4258 domain-containing protein [Chloroflexi bacterium CFX6]
MPLPPVTRYRLTSHALQEMERRNITEAEVAQVLANPEQSEMIRDGRSVYQARIEQGDPPKEYLLRVFVDIDDTLPSVVTVYRTSKIRKYWR